MFLRRFPEGSVAGPPWLFKLKSSALKHLGWTPCPRRVTICGDKGTNPSVWPPCVSTWKIASGCSGNRTRKCTGGLMNSSAVLELSIENSGIIGKELKKPSGCLEKKGQRPQ